MDFCGAVGLDNHCAPLCPVAHCIESVACFRRLVAQTRVLFTGSGANGGERNARRA
ncbi:hypothetical protein BURKHO8Y_160080 [Burkholderia sp. 8Y]|nr:hypothetical protein BURKHO8Y_160080 [Burkholderia sp. 8Y]